MNFKHDSTYSTKACKVQAYAGVLWITSFIQYRVFSAETMQTMSILKFAWWVRGKSIQLLRCMQYSCWLKLLNSSLEIKFCPAINCKISGQEPSNYSCVFKFKLMAVMFQAFKTVWHSRSMQAGHTIQVHSPKESLVGSILICSRNLSRPIARVNDNSSHSWRSWWQAQHQPPVYVRRDGCSLPK